ncbi:beta-ketoacyl-[acyl-carrier-protein] synthase family protein [Streptomyces coacervatus]|uniref:beta-ketoacyl-[acyl-carrier-protein] synthase family protein n=1 Tax=Streptomyces coacervatus TaxID=647381 RepID=UPI0023DBC871|nr:beta-ketoacyl-[acyl-carrier-protein] synthase family protein [Streptomyces coacervatus]MDF2265147.1 beta-ketoacyl-[acyl-carrier-protein] synthase family protein [Streptomyces coacervatus]
MNAAADDVVITGIGLVTPAGIGREATWEHVCAGRPTAARDPELAGLPVDFACRVPGFDAREQVGGRRPWQYDRYTQYALVAAREAVADAGLSPQSWEGDRVAVVLGSAAGGAGTFEEQHGRLTSRGPGMVSPLFLPMFLPNMAAGQLGIDLRARGPNLHTSTACASGATAIGTACGLLAQDACDIAVAGGSDAMVTRLCAAGFAKMGALSRSCDPQTASRPFDADRDGFVLAEGAGVLVLERAADARARGVHGHAVLAGYGASADAHQAVAPDPHGAGAELALRRALAAAHARPDEVDHVNAHGTGTPLNDSAEAATLLRVLGDRPSVTSVKGTTGHLMGAAGAVEAALTALTVARGAVPPTANLQRPLPGLDFVTGCRARPQQIGLALSNSFGFGGHNAVLAFRPVG